MSAQILIAVVLLATMALFLWGHWRHDLVALAALLLCVALGVVPESAAFAGFSHPAVISVACVLVLGYGLQHSGAVDILSRAVLPASAGPTMSILALIGLAALLSGFMNNVGALALLMPVAIQMSGKLGMPPGRVLMPLAFGSILGGMSTLIGTPPNLIVSGYRASTGAGAFSMFDFAPVGVAVAVLGVLFVGLVGWRLVPARKQSGSESFESGKYLSEVRILAGSKAIDHTLREAEHLLEAADAQIVGMVKRGVRISAPNPRWVLRDGDILVIEVDPESLASALSSLGLRLEEDVPAEPKEEAADAAAGDDATTAAATAGTPTPSQSLCSGDAANELVEESSEKEGGPPVEVVIQELVVMPNSSLINRSATDIELRTAHGINLLAISREGRRSIKRLRTARFQAGDVLLMQGEGEAVAGFAASFGCLPLATRNIRVPKQGHALKAALVMAAAVGLAALGWVPAALAFAGGALAMVVLNVVPLRSIYSAIDWSVIILLGAMLPIADAVATTGAANTVAHFLLSQVADGQPVVALVLLLVVTMFLSDVMNNAATAAVMCPIAASTAAQLGVHPDAFFMAIAVGASCAFLTPIGHQNNTLILGPGGFRFGDYWRLGLPLEMVVVAVSVPMILWAWPF